MCLCFEAWHVRLFYLFMCEGFQAGYLPFIFPSHSVASSRQLALGQKQSRIYFSVFREP